MSLSKSDLAGLTREEKMKLIADLAAKKKARAAAKPKRYPLSFAQERNWFLHRLDPESPAHSIFRSWRLLGTLDSRALDAAVRGVVRRHGGLRTTFAEGDKGVRQVVAPAASADRFTIEHVDLETDFAELDDTARDARLVALATDAARVPFDLETGPLVRVALLRLAETDHVIFLTLHHVIADGWSMGLLFRELRELYSAHVEGRDPVLAELPIQYGDFATWQRQKLDLDAQLDFWRDAIGDAPTVLDVPSDRVRPAVASLEGDMVGFTLGDGLSARLRELAQTSGTTLFMLLLAAFQALLHRLTGQRDLLIGSPIANRTRSEVQHLIGSFANTFVLRSRLGAEWPTFAELLAATKRHALAAYGRQDLPFERLVEALQPERDLSRNPLFQVMFSILDSSGGGTIELPGIAVEGLPAGRGLSKVDLTLEMITGDGDAISGYFEFATDLFDRSTIERMVYRYEALLQAITADPSISLGELPMMVRDEAERLAAINRTARPDYDLDTPLHTLVQRVGEATPDAVAVIACDAVEVGDRTVGRTGELTYRQLLDRSARLARHLVEARGVRRGDRVALCLERSVEAAVAFLAVLRAGAAYVPMDPGYPTERLRVTIEDCGARLLLAGSCLDDRDLPNHLGDEVEILVLDRDFETLTTGSGDDGEATAPDVEVSPLDVAYIIYTSGSTGRPKGVVVHHRAAANLAQAMVEHFELTPEDRGLQFASLAFDVTVEEIYPTWLAGATVVMRSERQSLAFGDFFRFLDAENVSVVNLPVPYWHEWVTELEAGRVDMPEALRLVVVGVEGPLPERLDAWVGTVGGHPRWINAYGPTETTVDCVTWDAPPASARPIRHVSIGRPIPNAQAWVVDHDIRSVPPGVPGELVIGGDGIVQGYLERPALTAEKFIPDPFSEQPGARLYRTGDRCRVLADDTIEFLGRVDFQVKIRGFRIEIGEIESALVDDPRVVEAAVLAKEVGPGDRRLVAWVAPVDLAASGLSESLREVLRDRLPGYMVPSQIVVMPGGLPVTSAGKVDRRALPEPDWAEDATTASQAPRTPSEEIVADVFRQVLDRKEIGIHDDFFALGGHSLLATRLLARLRTVLEIDLPLQAVFEAPTVAELARRVEDARRQASGAALPPPIVPIEREADARLPLSFAQQRMWFLAQLEPDSPAYHMPNALRFEGPFDLEILRRALVDLHARHETLRTTFHAERGEPYALVTPVDALEIELPVDRATDLDAALALAKDESLRPFDLATGPVLRCRVVEIDAADDYRDHLFVFTFHHIISDGGSTDLFIHELLTLYGHHLKAEGSTAEPIRVPQPEPLPPLVVQYADYAAWERDVFAGDVLDSQLGYWKEQLAGAPTVIDLPTDRPRPAVSSHRGARAPVHLPAELVGRLDALAREHGVTAFMLYLAAFAALLHRLARQEDVLIGTPVSGRGQTELESVLGFFANTLVMRFGFGETPAFADLLRQSREVVLGAHAHQDLPFERLVDEVQPERNLSHSALFQTLFVLHQAATMGRRSDDADGATETASDLPTVSLPSVDNQTSRFDLSLVLVERQDGYGGFLEYDVELFDAATVERFGETFATLLGAMADLPTRAISSLPLIDETERHRLTAGPVVERFADLDRGATLADRFEHHAAATPEAIAVRFEGTSVSYDELAERSGRLARRLRDHGVTEDVLVGIAMTRSVEMAVALLGVLRAGGAYVPLEPSYPADRLAFMIEDSGVGLVLTQREVAGALPLPEAVEAWILDDPDAPLDREGPSEPPARRLDPDHLAYMIYTSGSTGRPKAATNPHAAVSNFLLYVQDRHPLATGDAMLQKAPFSFDVSVWEFFWPLTVGATLVLAKPGGHQDPTYLAELIETEAVTAAHFVPSMLQVFLAEKGLDRLGSVRWIFAGGEALPLELVRRFYDQLPATAALFNSYGPTEAAIGVTCRAMPADSDRVPIGHAFTNTSLVVLDEYFEPCPVGVPGELYIGGDQLARGYHGRPALTAERFVPDAFGGLADGAPAGSRLYRSGDLARVLANGEIDFLGRVDHQVKVRGFRIELGEIEAVVNDHLATRESVVIARDQRLVAYVVRDDRHTGPEATDDAALVRALRDALGDALPEYMVPQAFVVLERLPLSPTGKVERRALPEPEIDRSTLDTAFVAPRNETEERLAGIWMAVLDLDQVGVHDRFFDLGGHSLLATQVMARVTEVFDLDLPLRTLFESPTIAGLADAILATEMDQVDADLLEQLLADL